MNRNKGYTFINIAGLGLAISICLLIFIFLEYHFEFDHFNKHADRVYRIAVKEKIGNKTVRNGNMQGPLAKALTGELPEVQAAVRIHRMGSVLINIENKAFYENDILLTDPSFFRVLGFSLIQGKGGAALENKNNIVITKSAAQKYFSGQDPLGKQILINENKHYTVTGIVKDPPEQSHLHYSMLVNIPDSLFGVNVNQWNNLSAFYTYLLLQKGAEPEEVLNKIPSVVKGKIADKLLKKSEFYLQPLTDIHLKSDLNWELFPQRVFNIHYIYLFALIGLFILLIACINYVNLSTARATTRLKEVGVRKTSGAQKNNLFWQFTGESLLLVFLAAVLSIVLLEILFPFINNLMEINLSLVYIKTPLFLTGFFLFIILIGTLSGIYPSIVLSSFSPSEVLKGKSPAISKGKLRKGLVILQFAVSMMLIIATLVIHSQLIYFRNINLGLNPAQVLNISLESPGAKQTGKAFINKLSSNSNILSVCASSTVPEKPGIAIYLHPRGANEESVLTYFIDTDQNFLKTFGINLISGRGINKEDLNRDENIAIVNKALVNEMGWSAEEAINKKYDRFKIIGVIENFHFKDFREKITPAILSPLGDKLPNYISAKLNSSNISGTMDWIRKQWKQTAVNYPFQFSFLDQTFESLYRSEIRLSTLFTTFSLIAIWISCSGLFGLMAFITSKRSKEIGLRKVLGADITNILRLLTVDFIKLVMTGFLIAAPVAWFAMNKWLQNFAYRTEINLWVFVIAGVIAFLFVIIAVGFQAVKTAISNPVEALRNE